MKTNRRETLAFLAALASGLAGCTSDDPRRSSSRTTETPTPTETRTQSSTRETSTTSEGTPTPEPTPEPTFEDASVPDFPAIDPVTNPRVDRNALAEQIRGNVGFTLDLFDVLRKDTSANLFFSPYSISTALAMTWAGARNDTETRMADALRFRLDQETLHPVFGALDREFERRNENGKDAGTPVRGEGDVGPAFELSVANALWGQTGYPFRDRFVDVLATHYDAGLESLDFAGEPNESRRRINGWVDERTNGHIPNLLSRRAITSNTRLVLTNAIYYRARWKHPFDPEQTEDRPFTALDGTTTDVPMMHREAKYEYSRIEDHQLVEIPYANRRTSMVIILPAEGEFGSFVDRFTVDRLAIMLDVAETALVDLTVPKFGIESKTSLVDALSPLGMETAFTADADFSGMVDGGSLRLDDVVHQSAVEVDELGTEAVGATAVLIEESLPRRQPELTIDRPFLFYVRDRPTETPLFFGQVTDAP